MADLDALTAHLRETYDFGADAVFPFQDDVILVRDRGGRRWVARVFPASRPHAAVEGDAEILAALARLGYPAERVADEHPVSMLEDRPVLVTRAVSAVPRARRRQAIKDAGGIRGLGALLGCLHRLEPEETGRWRSGGAWHHMAEGLPARELAVAADWLGAARERAGVRELACLRELEDGLAGLDPGTGLVCAALHPDFVLANVVATDAGMVLVDWAGAGRGPRAWSLAFLLMAEGAKDLRRVDLAVAGYRRWVTPEPEELARLEAMVAARPLIFDLWRLHHGQLSAVDAVKRWHETRRLAAAIARRARDAFMATEGVH